MGNLYRYVWDVWDRRAIQRPDKSGATSGRRALRGYRQGGIGGWVGVLGVALVSAGLICGCGGDDEAVVPVPPLLGFGDQTGNVDLGGDTLVVDVLWTRATTGLRELAYVVDGEGAAADHLVALTPSPLAIPAGATEARLLFRVADAPDAERAALRGRIGLEPGDWYRLAGRDTFVFGFSLTNTVELSIWAPDIAFPQLYGYTSFDDSPAPESGRGPSAGEHFALAHVSRTEPNVIGMFNTTEGLSTNALNLHTVYRDEDVSSGSADIRIPRLFRLTPDEEGATAGRVDVIAQRVEIQRKESSGLPPFEVGLSGEGRYDETTGVISVAVVFDESEIGRDGPVTRRYLYESERRSP